MPRCFQWGGCWFWSCGSCFTSRSGSPSPRSGFSVLTVGLILLVTPGPGLLVIIAGLAILAHQFSWAATALDKAKARAAQARELALRRARRLD
jgi:hypothetical protein